MNDVEVKAVDNQLIKFMAKVSGGFLAFTFAFAYYCAVTW